MPGGSGHGVHCSLLFHQGEPFSQELEANPVESIWSLLKVYGQVEAIHLKFDESLSSGGSNSFEVLYKFIVRWQQWTLQEVDSWPVTTLSARLVRSKIWISSKENLNFFVTWMCIFHGFFFFSFFNVFQKKIWPLCVSWISHKGKADFSAFLV